MAASRTPRRALEALWAQKWQIIITVWALLLLVYTLEGALRAGGKQQVAHVHRATGTDWSRTAARRKGLGRRGEARHMQREAAGSGGQQQAPSDGRAASGHRRCRVGQDGQEECECEEGYEGRFCELAVCLQGCEHGSCLRPSYCTCTEGWSGHACDRAICDKPCVHGRCLQPDFCSCDAGWFGHSCSQRCVHGTFSFHEQQCRCDVGWAGPACLDALCSSGCRNGDCSLPEQCVCFTGWAGPACDRDLVQAHAGEILGQTAALSFRPAQLSHVVLVREQQGDEAAELNAEAWKQVRRWTAGMGPQHKFGRTRFMDALPTSDPLAPRLRRRFRTCAAVGNSGGLLLAEAGAVIDMHQAVLRFDNAPTSGFEAHVGRKTTFKMLNRQTVDGIVAKLDIASLEDGRSRLQVQHRKGGFRSWPMTLLWRAESFHHYHALQQSLPDEAVYLVAPQLLVPVIALYQEVTSRMQAANVTWQGEQASPQGLLGAAFLLQICDSVDLYGFDAPRPPVPIHHHYFDRGEPTSRHEHELEFQVLRLMSHLGILRLCSVDMLEPCIMEDSIRLPPLLREAGAQAETTDNSFH